MAHFDIVIIEIVDDGFVVSRCTKGGKVRMADYHHSETLEGVKAETRVTCRILGVPMFVASI